MPMNDEKTIWADIRVAMGWHKDRDSLAAPDRERLELAEHRLARLSGSELLRAFRTHPECLPLKAAPPYRESRQIRPPPPGRGGR